MDKLLSMAEQKVKAQLLGSTGQSSAYTGQPNAAYNQTDDSYAPPQGAHHGQTGALGGGFGESVGISEGQNFNRPTMKVSKGMEQEDKSNTVRVGANPVKAGQVKDGLSNTVKVEPHMAKKAVSTKVIMKESTTGVTTKAENDLVASTLVMSNLADVKKATLVAQEDEMSSMDDRNSRVVTVDQVRVAVAVMVEPKAVVVATAATETANNLGADNKEASEETTNSADDREADTAVKILTDSNRVASMVTDKTSTKMAVDQNLNHEQTQSQSASPSSLIPHTNPEPTNTRDQIMSLRLRTTPQLLKVFDEKIPNHKYQTSFPTSILSENSLNLQNLTSLLQGTSIYIAPNPPKEINHAHEARMEELRQRLAEQDYQSLVATDPRSSLAESSSELRLLKNQISTIVNVLISIVTAAMAAWYWTPHWRTGDRVLASFGAAIMLGSIEAFLYFRYLAKIEQGKEFDASRSSEVKVKRRVGDRKKDQ
ncbi:protein of unknown function [Taphrina deformans PYCC 5710]|uniref:Uncharacterized protein n=1 Tax=Taphrina deformans (strain PYCC 5710 / ATCC 11124 / CBS 356.35 / IMI 108563 / JCM 9778 / NBRC 8474) TaxID=1097556 RepID=R4XDX0_TAPDE|nr:protein of unknown function [Taphrina deformans PYCC 5710]|eukprot:CCG81534.1 protein of unknown function [Taphrina deformans PYCC 5710]